MKEWGRASKGGSKLQKEKGDEMWILEKIAKCHKLCVNCMPIAIPSLYNDKIVR